MRDLAEMEIGQVVDYVEEYNRMHDPDKGKRSGKNKKGLKEPETVNKRRATQADWDAFLG